jgi:hypothetical protein
MDEFIITNAADMAKFNFACAVNNAVAPAKMVELDYKYSDTDKTFRITPKAKTTLAFMDFTEISFGQTGVDINWCDPTFFEYELGSTFDLSISKAFFTL